VKKLVITLVVLAAVLLVVDLVAKAQAESKVRERAVAFYPPGAGGSASIRSFPFLFHLLASGDVPEVTITMDNLRAGAVVIRRLTIDVRQVDLDRAQLFKGRVRVLDIGRGRIEATVDGPSVAQAAGVDLRFSNNEVEIHRRVGGHDLSARATVSVQGNLLRLVPIALEGLTLPVGEVTYRIPGAELLPCRAQVRVVDDGLRASCTIDDVPPALADAVQSGARP
jgi:hypothetical protein